MHDHRLLSSRTVRARRTSLVAAGLQEARPVVGARPWHFPRGAQLIIGFEFRSGLVRATFKDGKVIALESLRGADAQVESWRKASGAKDRPGEFVISTNPALAAVLKSGYMPYYGYGAGVVRLAIGDDWESGGPNRSSNGEFLLFLPGATLTSATKTLINAGALSLK